VKGFQVLLIIGGLLIIVGVYLAIPPVPFTSSHTANLPSGGNYYYELGLQVGKGGHISGTFSELSGNTIVLYLFNSAQYGAYRSGSVYDSMFQTSGTTGSFSANVLTPGAYYIVLQHGANTANQAQNVQVSYTIDGMNLIYLGSGLGVLIVGLVLAAFGYRRKSKVTPPRAVTDVVVFGEPKPETTTPA
jgi:hypothetical protein